MRIARYPKGVWPVRGGRLLRAGSCLSVAAGLACGLFQMLPLGGAGLPKDARSLHVICSRPSAQLLRDLDRAAERGVRVTLVTSEGVAVPSRRYAVHAAKASGPDGALVDGIRWVPLPKEAR